MQSRRSVCFVGVYENSQNQPLRAAVENTDGLDLTEIQVTERYFDAVASERRPPAILFRPFLIWCQKRFPRWFTPVMVSVWAAYHALLLVPLLIWHLNTVRTCDVVVVPHLGDVSFFAVYPFARLFGVPVVYINHSGLYPSMVENRELFPEGSVTARLLRSLDETIHCRSDRVVVLSHAAARKFSEMYGTSERTYDVVYVSVIPAYTEVETPSDTPAECDVLYWGGFHRHHGVEAMVAAAERTPDLEFTFIGSQDDADARLFEQSDADNVTAPGFVELEALVAHIEAADVILGPLGDNPVAEYVIGTKTAEAAFFGKAIVLGDQSAVNEVFTHRESAYLCTPGDPDAISEAVSSIVDDDELRTTLETTVESCYEGYFSPDAAESGYRRVLESELAAEAS